MKDTFFQPLLIAVMAAMADEVPGRSIVVTGQNILNKFNQSIEPYLSKTVHPKRLNINNIDSNIELLATVMPQTITGNQISIERIDKKNSVDKNSDCTLWKISLTGYMPPAFSLSYLFANFDLALPLGSSKGVTVPSECIDILEVLLIKVSQTFLEEASIPPGYILQSIIASAIRGALRNKKKLNDKDAYYIDFSVIHSLWFSQNKLPNFDLREVQS